MPRRRSLFEKLRTWWIERANQSELAKTDVVVEGNEPMIRGRIAVFNFGGRGRIRFGSNVVMNSGQEFNPVSGSQCSLIFLSSEATIEFGDHAAVSNITVAAATSVVIGPSAFIGAGAKIFDTDFHSLHAAHRLNGNVGIPTSPVVIGARAFIGADATILKGVSIGEEAVIGAGAVVTKDVPPFEIWAGNPARKIRDLGSVPAEDVARLIQKSRHDQASS